MFESKEQVKKRHDMRQKGILALDWQAVKIWAEQKPSGAILGRSCTNTEDPLGAYLGEKIGTPGYYWSIGPSLKNGYEDRIPKPQWVVQLMTEIDGETEHQSTQVTREQFLSALDRVKPFWVTDADQGEVLTMIDQALDDLDDQYQTSVPVVQVYLRQRGLDLDLAVVKMCLEIVRELKPER